MRIRDVIAWWLGRSDPPTPAPPPPPGDLAARLLAAVNAARERFGVRPLAPDPPLAGTAAGWAAALAAHGGDPGHGDWYARLTAAHPGRPISEDIAAGQPTPEQAVNDWLADPPHRRSILDPAYTVAGCGVATRPGGWTYYVIDLGG